MLCTNSAIKYSICPKLHRFDKSHGLKTSTCQCLVIDIAPPAGYRKLFVLHQIQHAMFNLHQTSYVFFKLLVWRHIPNFQFSYLYSATCWPQEIHCFTVNRTCIVQSAPNFMCVWCGSVVEHCVSSTKGCGFDSQGTHILMKMYSLNTIVSRFG